MVAEFSPVMAYTPSSWDLSKIQPHDHSFKEIEKATTALEAQRKKLTSTISPHDFLAILKEVEKLKIQSNTLSCYAYLRFAENTSDQEATAFMSKVETFLAKISNCLLFFNLWFKELPEKKAQELIHTSGRYHYFLEYLRKTKAYTLKENEEKIITIKDVTGVSALNTIYNILTSQFEFEFAGKKVTQEELLNFVRDPSAEKRESAYRTLLSPYVKHKDVLGEIYKNLINDWREENMGLRGYKSPLHVRNIVNDIPDEAVDVLLRVCEKNQHLFHRFFELKRKRLGVKKLRRFDLYAPLQEEKEKIAYDAAVKMVIQAYESFSPRFKKEALAILNADNVHSLVQKNKMTGAFCMSVNAQCSPFVLLSYTGKLRDVFTLAHELGHGVHHNLAREQTEFTFHAPLPLAETASIFGEMLLSEKLLREKPEAAKEMLFLKVDDLYASIIRQSSFVMFEKKAHKMMEEGKTILEMSEVYLADLKKQLGKNVEVDDIFAYEWCYIPHIFHTPFYCYAYAFGNLLTLALYEMYKVKGEPFAVKIIELLSKGGSESPVSMTKSLGIDITSEQFWQKGFTVIEEMIEKMEG